MTTKNNEIVAIEGLGVDPGVSEVARFLAGPQRRAEELLRAFRIFFEFVRGFRAFHFAGPCVTVFGSARFGENHPIMSSRGKSAQNWRTLALPS